MKLDDKGILVVLSGPSGVGKGTIRKALFEMEGHDLIYSVSMTTRKMRLGEVEGKDYFFVSREEFEEKIKNGEMLEYAEFVGNYYGTPLKYVKEQLNEGHEVVLEIEIQGATQVKSKMPHAVFIFIAPPSLKALHDRLTSRGTESEELIQKRFDKALNEMHMAYMYDYIVVNDDVHNAAEKIMTIIKAEHARTERTIHGYEKLLEVE
ncbi:MAG TPA: guanylate kinase [Acholeplasma sp.]|jgi:guanylate kinase|nr:guanylate kinase [Acholeplasma sp.]